MLLQVASDLNTAQNSGVLSARRQDKHSMPLGQHLTGYTGQSELDSLVVEKHSGFSHMVQKRIWGKLLNSVFILNSVVPGNKSPGEGGWWAQVCSNRCLDGAWR